LTIDHICDMEKLMKSQNVIFLALNDFEQIEICSRKIEEAEKKGENQKALNWSIKGLNIAREIRNESKVTEFSNYIMSMM